MILSERRTLFQKEEDAEISKKQLRREADVVEQSEKGSH